MYSVTIHFPSIEHFGHEALPDPAFIAQLHRPMAVLEIEAATEEEALERTFERTQNITGPWNPAAPCRSASVGDVFEIAGRFHKVLPVGFQLLALPAGS